MDILKSCPNTKKTIEAQRTKNGWKILRKKIKALPTTRYKRNNGGIFCRKFSRNCYLSASGKLWAYLPVTAFIPRRSTQFDQLMNKALKYGLLIFGIVIITVVGLIGFGLYSMEIEDHYGDLKELYYDSEDGDLIVNKTTSEFGTIEKNWKRINIKTQQKDSTDLYNWVYQNGTETKSEIYRAKNGETELNGITYSELKKMIEKSELKLVTKN